jgi:hypothetical protein
MSGYKTVEFGSLVPGNIVYCGGGGGLGGVGATKLGMIVSIQHSGYGDDMYYVAVVSPTMQVIRGTLRYTDKIIRVDCEDEVGL